MREPRKALDIEGWAAWRLLRLCSLPCLQPSHSLYDEMSGALQCECLGLRTQNMNANRIRCLCQARLPVFDAVEHQWDQLGSGELPAARVDPDDGLVLLGAQEDHVVVGRHDHLVRPARVIEYDVVARATRRRLVALVADVTRVDPELAKSPSDSPGQQLIEEQSNVGSPRRDATSCYENTVAARS